MAYFSVWAVSFHHYYINLKANFNIYFKLLKYYFINSESAQLGSCFINLGMTNNKDNIIIIHA